MTREWLDMARLHPTAAAAALALTLTQTACAGGAPMKPEYPKAAIRDLVARAADGELTLRYSYPMESMYYSGGVDVAREGGVLKLVIARCKLEGECKPDVPSRLQPPNGFEAEVVIPWQGERVVVVHSDGEQQIAP